MRYCKKFNAAVKEKVRDEFSRTCFLCGAREGNGPRLAVHHIDYNKNTLCNGKRWGLVPLCNRCHVKTNTKKWYWFSVLSNYWAYNWLPADCIAEIKGEVPIDSKRWSRVYEMSSDSNKSAIPSPVEDVFQAGIYMNRLTIPPTIRKRFGIEDRDEVVLEVIKKVER